MVSQLDCLNANECLLVKHRLHHLKNQWEYHLGEQAFYTLGATRSIHRAKKGEFFYRLKVKRFNLLLKKNFQFLYRKMAEVLEKEIGKPVVYEENYGYPSFHIFFFSQAFKSKTASLRFDLQFQEPGCRYQESTLLNILCITLPISLPKRGSGMYCWDIRHHHVKNLSNSELQKRACEQEPVLIEFEEGQVTIYEGSLLHQTAPFEEIQDDDEKITLQGYAFFNDGAWHLYG